MDLVPVIADGKERRVIHLVLEEHTDFNVNDNVCAKMEPPATMLTGHVCAPLVGEVEYVPNLVQQGHTVPIVPPHVSVAMKESAIMLMVAARVKLDGEGTPARVRAEMVGLVWDAGKNAGASMVLRVIQ